MFPWTPVGLRREGGGGGRAGKLQPPAGKGDSRQISVLHGQRWPAPCVPFSSSQLDRSKPSLSLAQGLSLAGITACVLDGGLNVTYCVLLTSGPVLDGTVQLLYPPSPHSGQLLLYFFFDVKFTQRKINHFNSLFCFGHVACGILVSQPGIKPTPLAPEARRLNHWTAREFLKLTVERVIYFWMCCTGFLSGCGARDALCGGFSLRSVGVGHPGFSSCGPRAPEHGLNS